jgi:hypothetical protein
MGSLAVFGPAFMYYQWADLKELLNLEAERCAQTCEDLAGFPFENYPGLSVSESARLALQAAASMIRQRKESRE